MDKRTFTKSQRSAIDTRDKTLLVSAAAGSGKTATLIERIIESILDPEHPTEINKMLIVTFTKAAASELRSKVSAALTRRLETEPENKRLEEQLYLLPSAKISTIDAFCNSILKNNTEKFGISPRYRIADPIEAKILSHTVWSELIEAAYSGKLESVISPDDFELLADTVTSVKSSSALEEVFESLYEHSKTHETGVSVFKGFADALDAELERPIEENKYTKFAIRRAHEIAEHYIGTYDQILMDFPEEESGIHAIEWFVKHLLLIREAESYSEIREHLLNATAKTKETAKKGAVAPELLACKESIKDALSKRAMRYFKFSAEDWYKGLQRLSRLVRSIAVFIEYFDAVFFEEKRHRGILEYSDIERLTYLSLYNPDGTLTDFAEATRRGFDAVYIDEYQDVNLLQNKIFEAISTEKNRFMVGDIKQSIYVFRSARPDIFADMKNTFPALENAEGSDIASIFMSENFRCDEVIVDFVNSIFDTVFTLFGESIGYVPEDRLKYSKKDGTAAERILPELHIFASENGDTEEEPESEGEDDEDEIKPARIWVANKIAELVGSARLNNGERVRPSDIAILLRTDRGRCRAYTDALAAVGIPARAPDDKNFFFNSEIRLALCLLNTIDNPRRDIYLAGLLLSPLYSFTPDELYLIRRGRASSDSLWQSLANYCKEHPEFERGVSFIKEVNRYRAISEGTSVDALILRLYHETGLLALAKREGKEENLMLLYNYARKFEVSSFEGLYNFIKYIGEVVASNSSFASASRSESEDAVTILTMHKSKGLEYPIVFIADAEVPLVPQMEKTVKVSYSDEYGIGMKTRSESGYSLIENPIHNVIIDSNIEKILEEELRVYYVAMTRARERLFVVADLKKSSRDEYAAAINSKRLRPSRETLWEMKRPIDLIMLCDPAASIVFEDREAPRLSEKETRESAEKPPFAPEGISVYETLTERFSFKYPNEHLTVLPEKMSVSKLYPAVLDEMDAEDLISLDAKAQRPEGRLGILPEFLSGDESERSARRGIATHTFLQFFDIKLFDTGTAEDELKRLVERKFISKENAELVRLDEIALFKGSELYSEMKNAARLYREFRFSVMLPASLFTESEEKRAAYSKDNILLQGVIDCLIEDSCGDLHLIDYKTDRLSPSEKREKELAREKLSKKHSLQLSYYALAVEKIFSKKPKSTRIYSLPLGDTVDI